MKAEIGYRPISNAWFQWFVVCVLQGVLGPFATLADGWYIAAEKGGDLMENFMDSAIETRRYE